MSDVAERIRKIIVEHLRVDEAKVTENAILMGDLGADSLEKIQLIMAFENEFELKIPDYIAEKIATVKQVVSFIEAQRRDRPISLE
jgi:acyl carrier protein